LHDEIVPQEVDEHHNPKGRGFDLGHEKAFGQFKVILFNGRLAEVNPKEKVNNLWYVFNYLLIVQIGTKP
jgi:hypothetical protein